MKKAIFILAILTLGSCKRYYNPESEVSTTDKGKILVDVPRSSADLRVFEFEVDQCKYFTVYSTGSTTTAVNTIHKANCPNH